jgi:hypothetical protein
MKNIIFVVFVAVAFSGCNSISKDDLYGKWKYVKVEKPNATPPDSVRSSELKYEAPSIQFTKQDSLIIIWGGKVLSHGKFTTKGRNIQYTEQLPDGSNRKFPFWVMELNNNQIVFETSGEDGSRVTAVRE